MLAADTYFEFGFGCATLFNTHLHELANAFLIEYFEGIGLDDAMFLVELEELGSVVAREAEGHLGKVVCTEREEVSNLCNLVCNESCTGHLNHCTNLVGYAAACFLEYLCSSDVDDVCLVLDFLE